MFDLNNKEHHNYWSAGLMGNQFAEIILKFNGNPILIDINQKKLEKIKKKLSKKFKKRNTCI